MTSSIIVILCKNMLAKLWQNKHILFLFIMLLFISDVYAQLKGLKIENGIAHINKGEINNEIFLLKGKWEFYPYQLLSPNDFKLQNFKDNLLVDVPKKWNEYIGKKGKKTSNGYATYRLKIIHFGKNKRLAFRIGNMFTASKVYVDGEKLSELGTVGINKQSSVSNFYPTILKFIPKSDTSEIIIQISNFDYAKGGPIRDIEIGKEDAIQEIKANNNNVDLFLIGSLFIMALYHLGLFILRTKNRSALFFGLLCFVVGIRLMVTDEIYILNLLPNLQWNVRIRLEYITFYISPIILHLFLYFLFEKRFHKSVLYFNIIITAIYVLIALLFNVVFITSSLISFQVFSLLLMIYLLYILIKAILEKEKGAIIFLIGFAILMLTFINDILYYNNVINTIKLSAFGLFSFIFLQSYLLSKQFNASFVTTEKLSDELNVLNKSLENIIEERTKEIQRKNSVLNKQNTGILSSINYAKHIQTAMLPFAERIKEYIPEYFIFYKARDIISGDFYWIEKVENKVIIAIADCTGHGVPGAFMSMLGNSGLDDAVFQQKITEPHLILKHLHTYVSQSLKQEESNNNDGMDISIVVWDKNEHKVEYAGAMNPIYFVQNGALHEIKGTKNPIGGTYRKAVEYITHTISVDLPTSIYLATDGFQDQFGGPNDKKFRVKNFRKLLHEASFLPLSEQKSFIKNTFEQWQKNEEQVDDILVFGMKI